MTLDELIHTHTHTHTHSVEKLHSTTEFASTAHPEYGVVAQHDFRRVDTHNTQSVEKLHSTARFASTAHPEYGVVAQHNFR